MYGPQVTAEPRPLTHLLDDALVHRAHHVALRMDAVDWSYQELAGLVDRFADYLAGLGVGRGSRLALCAGNNVEFVGVVLATARLGATLVMVSTAWREREVAHAVSLTDPTHIVHDGAGAARLDQLVTDRPVIRLDAVRAHADALRSTPGAGHPRRGEVGLDDVAVVVFSSGTTGLPKAVLHSHRTMHHAIVHWIVSLGMTSDDRLQIATPPSHILGLLNLLAVVAAGASVRLHRRFDLDAVLTAIESDRITIEMAVAPIALAIAAHPHLEQFDLSSLRYIMWGATPVTPSVAETIHRRCGVGVLPAYGASELPVIAVNPVDRPEQWRLDSVGLTPPGVELRVVDLETGAVLGPGSAGELQGRSPSSMLGYLPAEANDAAFVDGWYRTGDVGAIDADGWVTITDRVKEMIKVNGFQVAPAEIEAVLLGHPDVVDCAVYGIAHERTGEAVVAAVVLAADSAATADELRTLVADSLAGYKRIHEIRLLAQIPRLPSGKVLRRDLRATHLPEESRAAG